MITSDFCSTWPYFSSFKIYERQECVIVYCCLLFLYKKIFHYLQIDRKWIYDESDISIFLICSTYVDQWHFVFFFIKRLKNKHDLYIYYANIIIIYESKKENNFAIMEDNSISCWRFFLFPRLPSIAYNSYLAT